MALVICSDRDDSLSNGIENTEDDNFEHQSEDQDVNGNGDMQITENTDIVCFFFDS